MSIYTVRYMLSLGNVALSLVFGVIALLFCYVYFPNFTLSLFKSAEGIRLWIGSLTGNPQHEIIARAVLHESSIVLMGFTLLGFFITFAARLMRGPAH